MAAAESATTRSEEDEEDEEESDHAEASAPSRPPWSKQGSAAPAGLGLKEALGGGRAAAGMSQEAKRRRAELLANLQWLCRLFLETREQLYAAHDGTPTEEAVCTGLREELDAVRFRRLLEDALTGPEERRWPIGKILKLLRSFGRRVLHGRGGSAAGRRAHEQLVAFCTGHASSKAFVLAAVPRVLRHYDRLIEEGRRGGSPTGGEGSAGVDPWADVGGEADRGDGGWEMLDRFLEQHRAPDNIAQLHEEAGDFMKRSAAGAGGSLLAPLQLPAEDARQDAARPPSAGSGGRAPRGRGQHGAGDPPEAAATVHRLPAQAPFYSGDPAQLAKLAKAPLSNLDSLVAAMVPGAELTTEGLLLQLADEELVMFAYTLEQLNEAASRKLVKELETRDELQSTCMHRREYLQLLSTVG